jgi:hypothetical protein
MSTSITPFEDYNMRRQYDEEKEIWYFSLTDIIQALTQQPDKLRSAWKQRASTKMQLLGRKAVGLRKKLDASWKRKQGRRL